MTSAARASFYETHFPGSSSSDWMDWRWQLRHRLRDAERLEHVFSLTAGEIEAFAKSGRGLPLGITPYYAALIDRDDPDDPLRKTMIPRSEEQVETEGELKDPLGEDERMPVPGLVHTYPDKVLLLATDFCAVYCRYCTRSRMVGAGEYLPDRAQWGRAIDYIRQHEEVRDVLISGGDPLILADDRLEWLLSELNAIPHVEIIRIGTKIPAVLPQRITPTLAGMLCKYHPLWISVHFTHPAELTPEVEKACAILADAGIPLCSQTVLLAGVNDDDRVMSDLMTGLLRFRVKPYYLHQCDPVLGSSHFKTTVERGQEIIRRLHGHTTGYAVPMYMLDAPGGGGKVPIGPNYIERQTPTSLVVRNYRNHEYEYVDHSGPTLK